jgi:hypothetical protein
MKSLGFDPQEFMKSYYDSLPKPEDIMKSLYDSLRKLPRGSDRDSGNPPTDQESTGDSGDTTGTPDDPEATDESPGDRA